MLLALWFLATVEGVGSARQLARLCAEHDAYRWLCGGVPINYHMLSDFRVAKQAALDELLTQIVASLMATGAVSLERVAQDGMRVRASAGASSFDSAKGVIVGVAVTASGSDARQAPAMEEQIERRTGRRPKAYLMDGGFAAREDITLLEERGATVYAPVRQPKSRPEEERYQTRYGDTDQVIAWRQRMASEEGKAVYRRRGATAEWANAQVRQHGLSQFSVRGLTKAATVLLLVAVAHNLLRWLSIQAA